MMRKTIFLGAIILLLAGLVIGSWLTFGPRSDTGPAADRFFGGNMKPKDNSISDLLSQGDQGFARAAKPREFKFPEDHGAHNQYRTEWWYFTGNLQNPEGRRFGYELTFFRFALSSALPASTSAWRNNQLYMAHLTLTDVQDEYFYSAERFSRAGNDLAGAANDRYRVWLYDWSATAEGDKDFPLRLRAKTPQFAVDLLLAAEKGAVLQGDNGLSRKSSEPGNASYYYSYTRLPTSGQLRVGDTHYAVTGSSWMDREWSTSALSDQQSGWDWFALQFSDNSELMFYRLRRKDGQPDNHSSGSLVLSDGTKIALNSEDVSIAELDDWRSPHSGIRYPALWQLTIPGQNLQVTIEPLINDQELNLSVRYWEGAVSISGAKNGKPISGQGYVELAGYQTTDTDRENCLQ